VSCTHPKSHQCLKCASYIALGPAADNKRVLIELRATEIADEYDGQDEMAYRLEGLDGWLVRIIVNHDQAQRDLDELHQLTKRIL
jgi:hypothetical protein